MRCFSQCIWSRLVSLQSEVQNAMSSLLTTQLEIDKELKADILSSLVRFLGVTSARLV